jgi:hypothetical protein
MSTNLSSYSTTFGERNQVDIFCNIPVFYQLTFYFGSKAFSLCCGMVKRCMSHQVTLAHVTLDTSVCSLSYLLTTVITVMTVGTSAVAELIICTIYTQKASYIRCHRWNIGILTSDPEST